MCKQTERVERSKNHIVDLCIGTLSMDFIISRDFAINFKTRILIINFIPLKICHVMF